MGARSLEVCAAFSAVGVVTNNFWTCITPDKDAEDEEGLAVVAVISEIFAKRKKKRDKMKSRAKQAVMSKEQHERGVTIKDIIQGCSKAAGAEEEKTKATGGGKLDDEMGDGAARLETQGFRVTALSHPSPL